MTLSESLFRYRRIALILIFVIGFWSPFDRTHGMRSITTWLWLSGMLSRYNILPIAHSAIFVIGVATLLALFAALLRTWGTAYLGNSVVQDPDLHVERMVADGPYRHLRNPLYVGLWFYTLAISILMPPGGALFTVVAVTALTVAMVRAEEQNLRASRGEAYAAYLRLVPRFFPSILPRVPAGTAQPRWLQSFLAESYTWGMFLTYLIFAGRYNVLPLIQGVLISLGVSALFRAFMRTPISDAP